MVFAGQSELFPVVRTPGCIRHEIGNCLAPCAAGCTQSDYGFHVEAALDFLRGKDATPLEQLERQMNEAAAAQLFERACVLRDRLKSLQWLHRQLDRLRQAVRQSWVYPVAGHDGDQAWYLIRDGLVRAVTPAPVDEATRAAARAKMVDVYAAGCSGPPGLDEVDGVLLVDGWFRRQRQEKERLLAVEAARA